MAREVTRQEFLRTAGRVAAAVASSGALASLGSAATASAALAHDERQSALRPRAGARHVCVDTPLSITFREPPVVGTSGLIRIVSADGTVVDSIDLASPTQTRMVGLKTTPLNYHPVIVSGNRASIYPHRQLAYGETYSVLVDAGVFATADGQPLPGITDPRTWRFTTRRTAPTLAHGRLTVAADGTGDFCTVQGAVDLVPAGNTSPVHIRVRRGTYTEIVYVAKSQPFITVTGEDRVRTAVEYANNNALNGSNRAMFGVDASDFTLSNITLRNTTPEGGTQAEAFHGSAQRILLDHVNLISRQDTLMLQGAAFVNRSFIEGDVDFMWGTGGVFFERCELRARARTITTAADYHTQIRNTQTTHGNVYHRCRLTPDPDGAAIATYRAYLARIDPNVFPFSQVVYLNCAMGPHVLPAGWLLNNATAAPSVQFWEFGSTDLTGATLDVSQREPFSRQITAAEAAQWSDPQFVLGWTPEL